MTSKLPREAKPKLPKEANLCLEKHLRELGLDWMPEYKFMATRRWRFDYLLCRKDLLNRDKLRSIAIAIEIEGAVWTQGRHTRGSGFIKDMEKYNEAAMMGYRVLRFSTQQVLDGSAKAFLKSWLSWL